MRIVSLLSSATEILFALGIGEQVVAISHECDYPPEATKLPRATRSIIDSSKPSHEIDKQVKHLLQAGQPLYEIDRDLILSLQPDLIVTQAQCDVCAVRYADVLDLVARSLELKQTLTFALNPQSLDEILADIARVASTVGLFHKSESYRLHLQRRIEAIRSKTLDLPRNSRPNVVVIEWTEPLMTAGNWIPGLVHLAGGRELLAQPNKHSEYHSWSEISDMRPDVLIVALCGFNLERSMLEARRLTELPGYRDLPTVANGRAFVVDGNAYVNRSGPRIIDSLEIFAHLIRPDLFEPPSGALMEGRAWSRLI